MDGTERKPSGSRAALGSKNTHRAHAAPLRSPGLLVAAVALVLYATLEVANGVQPWGATLVPRADGLFYDLRNVTTAWDCAAQGADGRDLMIRNPCDPDLRPANYPHLWVLPWTTGLRSSATTPLGVVLALLFLTAALWVARGSSFREGLVWAIALTSPAVVLGIERGNVDLAVFAVVVAAIALLRRSTWRRALAHGLLLFAAALKLFPALGFVVLLRQPGRWRSIGAPAVAGAFGLYCLVTAADIRTFLPAVPQEHLYSFGAGVLADALDVRHARAVTATAVVVAAGIGVLLAVRRRLIWETPEQARSGSESLDAFVVGAAVFVGAFAVFQNWDYRFVFLLLTIPQLLTWAHTGARVSPVPAPRLTLGAVIGALWVGAFFSRDWVDRTPWDEIVNWFVFGSLLSALIALLVPAVQSIRPRLPATHAPDHA